MGHYLCDKVESMDVQWELMERTIRGMAPAFGIGMEIFRTHKNDGKKQM